MVLETIADITPGGTATALLDPTSSEEINATWIKLVATGTTCRFGDSSVASGRGALLPAGVPVTIERGDFDQQGYNLKKVFVFASGGDKVSITYGV